MKLNAVSITSADLRKTAEFYSLLGFKFKDFKDDEPHIEIETQGGSTKLMIDTKQLIKEIVGEVPKPGNHSTFAIQYDSVNEVDEIVKIIKEKGYKVIKEPWDAFWGQRYAIVEDPDGYKLDLYASLK